MRRRPPDMSLTRFTYSFAMSLKMSLAPHEPCILMTMGDWATEIIGAEMAAAPAVAAAPVRNLRRVGFAVAVTAPLLPFFMDCLLVGWCFVERLREISREYRLSGNPIPAPGARQYLWCSYKG